MKRLEDYPKPLQEILYKLFQEHIQAIDITYHSCKIENDNITKNLVQEALKDEYIRSMEQAIDEYYKELKEKR